MLFLSLMRVPVVKNSHILAGTYFIIVKERPRPNNLAIPNLDLSEKIEKEVIK